MPAVGCEVYLPPLEAVRRAVGYGATAVQIYLGEKAKSTLKYKWDLSSGDIKNFRTYCKKQGLTVYVHANLMLNLTRHDIKPGMAHYMRYRWILDNLIYDLNMCNVLGVAGLVLHVGSTLGEISIAQGARNFCNNLERCIHESNVKNIKILLENSAGEGSEVGVNPEEMTLYLEKLNKKGIKCGVCVDTAHAFAAGIDPVEYLLAMGGYVKLTHLNDSAVASGLRLDRHASIGDGYLFGNAENKKLREYLRVVREVGCDIVLETKDPAKYKREIKLVKGILGKISGGGDGGEGGIRQAKADGGDHGGIRQEKADGGDHSREITIFEELEKIYEAKGNGFRAKSYKSLINKLKKGNLTGITAKSMAKIAEIRETGSLKLLEELRSEDSALMGVIELSGVIGIGNKRARELVDAGFGSIAELRKGVDTGVVKLNSEQMLGLKYYDDFARVVDRGVVEKYIKAIPGAIPAGSYRRGAKKMKDIDVIVVGHGRPTDFLKGTGIKVLDVFHEGDVQLMAAVKLRGDKYARHLDLRVVPLDLVPFYLLHFGSGMEFSRKIKMIAKKQGFKLNEYGLFFVKTGERIEGLKSEEDIFDYLGVPYVAPEDR